MVAAPPGKQSRMDVAAMLKLAFSPRRGLLALSVACCLLVMAPIYWPASHGLDIRGHPIGRDFINYWAGPRLAGSGQLATLFDFDSYLAAISRLFGQPLPFHSWSYPPSTLVLFWPLAQLPYFWALAVWTLGGFAAFAFVATRPVEPRHRAFILAALACAPASIINAVSGQNGFLTAALILGGVLALKPRPILAGVLFGVLTIKPQLGLVLPLALLAMGAWRTIAAACVTAGALAGASVLAFGVEPWREYLTTTSAFQLQMLRDFLGFYRFMMTSVMAEARLLGAPFGAAALLQAAVSLPVLLSAAWAVTRTDDPRRRAFVLVAAAPLVTPYVFNYDLTALGAVLAWRLSEQRPEIETSKDLVFRLAWLTPILAMALNLAGLGLAPLLLLAVYAIAFSEAAEWAMFPTRQARKLGV